MFYAKCCRCCRSSSEWPQRLDNSEGFASVSLQLFICSSVDPDLGDSRRLQNLFLGSLAFKLKFCLVEMLYSLLHLLCMVYLFIASSTMYGVFIHCFISYVLVIVYFRLLPRYRVVKILSYL